MEPASPAAAAAPAISTAAPQGSQPDISWVSSARGTHLRMPVCSVCHASHQRCTVQPANSGSTTRSPQNGSACPRILSENALRRFDLLSSVCIQDDSLDPARVLLWAVGGVLALAWLTLLLRRECSSS